MGGLDVEMWRGPARVPYNLPMRHVGRLLSVLAAAGGPAVVTLFACNVDTQFNGLKNEVPNVINTTPILSIDGGILSTGTGGGSTGTAMSLCDCAESIVSGAASCTSCEQKACQAQYTACQATTCPAATQCVYGCNNVGPCIANCIAANPAYQTFLECLLSGCASSCGRATPLSCPLGGDGGPPLDAATGG
jgi:hypothetical protein